MARWLDTLAALVLLAGLQAACAPHLSGLAARSPGSAKEAGPAAPFALSSTVRFTHRGRVEAVLRQDGRLVQGRGPTASTFGVLRRDWTFSSPGGVVYARLHTDGRLELAHGNGAAMTIADDGTSTLPNGQSIGLTAGGSLTGIPSDESEVRLLGLGSRAADRRAAMFVFFAWSLTNSRLETTQVEVRELRRTIDVALVENGGRCPRSMQDLVAQGLLGGSRRTTDSWGSEYRIQCAVGTAPLVTSDGPDRRAGTADDIRSDR